MDTKNKVKVCIQEVDGMAGMRMMIAPVDGRGSSHISAGPAVGLKCSQQAFKNKIRIATSRNFR